MNLNCLILPAQSSLKNLPEQTDIGDVLDEAATDIEPETSEMPESEFSELMNKIQARLNP